jgi:hypothetical protein
VAGKAPKDYSDPVEFFRRRCFTRALCEHTGMVLKRLQGKMENTAPVLTLITPARGVSPPSRSGWRAAILLEQAGVLEYAVSLV